MSIHCGRAAVYSWRRLSHGAGNGPLNEDLSLAINGSVMRPRLRDLLSLLWYGLEHRRCRWFGEILYGHFRLVHWLHREKSGRTTLAFSRLCGKSFGLGAPSRPVSMTSLCGENTHKGLTRCAASTLPNEEPSQHLCDFRAGRREESGSRVPARDEDEQLNSLQWLYCRRISPSF
jgi:hypothetical protein